MSPRGRPLLPSWSLALLGGALSLIVAIIVVGLFPGPTRDTSGTVAEGATVPTPALPILTAELPAAPTPTLPASGPDPSPTPAADPITEEANVASPAIASPTPWLRATNLPAEPAPETAAAITSEEVAPEPAMPPEVEVPAAPPPPEGPGQPARMVIPKLRLDQRVRDVFVVRGAWQVADWAVGHHSGSALLGQRGNAVFSGHNNINGEVFRYLDKLEEGDRIDIISTDGRTFSYEVNEKLIVLDDGASPEQQAKNASYMYPTRDERITLLSCWPYQPWPPYRIIVIARPAA